MEFGVTHIAAIGEEFVDDTAPGIAYFHHDISDDDFEGTKMAENLRTAAAFVNDAISGGGRCLVHCAAGISRSATVVLAYRVLYGKLTLRAAFAELYGCRKCIWPNDGFMEALIALERDVFKGVATIELDQYVQWGEYDPECPKRCPRQVWCVHLARRLRSLLVAFLLAECSGSKIQVWTSISALSTRNRRM